MGVDLELHPVDHSKLGLVAFSIVLKQEHGRWLVVAVAPVASLQPTGSQANIQAAPDFGPAARGSAGDRSRIGQNWILLPVAVVAMPLLALLVSEPRFVHVGDLHYRLEEGR